MVFRTMACSLALFALASCGGEGGSTIAPPTGGGTPMPSPTPTPTPGPTKVLSENEADYYTNNIPNVNFTVAGLIGVSLDGLETMDDSNRLNQAISELSNRGGGALTIEAVPGQTHIYLREVVLQSNVHLKIASNVTIRPYYGLPNGGEVTNTLIFDVGMTFAVENVAITPVNEDSTNPADWYKVDVTGGDENNGKGLRVIFAAAVNNFKFTGMSVTDSVTRFSNIGFNSIDESVRQIGVMPFNGVVKNMVTTNNHVGFGLIQARSAINVIFKNLDSDGGIALRLESGQVAETAEASLDKIVGRDIVSRNGDAALNMSPHRITQGVVDVRGISAFNSTHAVQIAAGFFDNKPSTVNNLGTFASSSVIAEIRQVMGGQTAQVKSKDFGAYECDIQNDVQARFDAAGRESVSGPSIAVVRDNADPAFQCVPGTNGCYTVNLVLPNSANVTGTHLGDDLIFHVNVDKKTCT